MAERELRRMNRMELIEIIYALKQHEEELERQNPKNSPLMRTPFWQEMARWRMWRSAMRSGWMMRQPGTSVLSRKKPIRIE